MKTNFKHTLSEDAQEAFETNGVTIWRPSIAMPLFVGFGLKKAQCGCGRTFKDIHDFYAHYIYYAVWQNESNYIPELLAKERKAGATLNELKHQEKVTTAASPDVKPTKAKRERYEQQ